MSSITAQSVQATILAFLDQAKMYMNAYGIYGLAAIPAFWLTYYVGFNVLMYIRGPVDLKKKYNAEWALVTGAGTGIGKSLAHALALQGLNVVLVSLPDKHLDATTKELQSDFPDLEFRAVKAVFDHTTDYMYVKTNSKCVNVKTSFSLPAYSCMMLVDD